MEFTSILDLQENPDREEPRAPFFQDLNLNRIIEQICREWEGDVSSFYYYFPATAECENYRKQVLSDVKQSGVYEALCRFVEGMQARQDALERKGRVHSQLQKQIWHISEVKRYCDALADLCKAMSDFHLQSRGMREFYSFLKEYLSSDGFQSLERDVRDIRGKLDEVELIVTYENGRISVSSGNVKGTYDDFLSKCFPDNPRQLMNPFGMSADVSDLELEILRLLQKRQPELFRDVEVFCGQHREYALEPMIRFAFEIKYYLSFYRFERSMQEAGFAFSTPQTAESETMYARGLYDLALACVNMQDNKTTVSNGMEYREGERFFVLTGPNQGGKTTFARSLGQLVYFTKMGLDVPAAAANVHYFSDLLTHFSVEESVESGKGKLKEELVRLSPMMRGCSKNAFVVINELFTTAANYDACIMGKRVLDHFTATRCRGIYVTHLKELAAEEKGIVSLCAMLDESGKQTFQIERGAPADSASAINQVNKYRLTYGQLKERLSVGLADL